MFWTWLFWQMEGAEYGGSYTDFFISESEYAKAPIKGAAISHYPERYWVKA